VRPFIKFGPEVVEASLAAGCHYLDTTGEQDWLLQAQTRWGRHYADAGLLLSPCIAQIYTTSEIAANIALETPGLDTLDVLVLWKGLPTYASTQTIFRSTGVVATDVRDDSPRQGRIRIRRRKSHSGV
jgi:hypothetical protein